MSKRLWLLVGLCVAFGCNGTDTRVEMTQPTGFAGGGGAAFVGVSPSVVTAEPVHNSFCPGVPPFLASFNLSIRSNSNSAIFLRDIRLQFTDRSGFSAPQVTLPAPVPITQFGSELSRTRDQFIPVLFRFGCGTGRVGTIVVIVDTDNGLGTITANQIRVPVN